MHSDKKRTLEDTWRPADLRRHITEDGRKHRGGESTERHRRDRDKERERTRERRDEVEKDRHADRRKEGSRDRRGNRERDVGDERDRERRREKLGDGNRHNDDSKETKERRRDREERHERERDKERHRDKEREREKGRERHKEEDREKRREEREKEREREKGRERPKEEDREKRRDERDKERRREERDREHRAERETRRREERGEDERDRTDNNERERRDRHGERERHRGERDDRRSEKDRRHEDGRHLEPREEREHKEQHRGHREDRERRHGDRGHQDEKRKPDGESRGRRDLKGSGEEVKHHRAREEPDKHRERRRREEEEEEEEDRRDKTSSKKSSEKTEDVEKVFEQRTASLKDGGHTEEPAADDEESAGQEYEDDFEDYEEDFEEADESEEEEEPQRPEASGEREEVSPQRRKEIEAIQRAMDEENERVGTAQSRHATSRGGEEEEEEEPKWSRGSEKNQSRASQRGKFIDFVAAKQREVSKKAATKQKKRSTELLRLIDLDFSTTFSLLDLPPVNEYDMYIRSFGTANTKQAYVQCNEDNADRDVQTEEVEVCQKWTQHPPEHAGACGDPNISTDKTTSETSFDSQRLTAFLRSASQVMVVLLEEEQAERRSLRKLRSQADALSFSEGSLHLNTKLPFLHGRSVSLVHSSQVQRHTLMSVHGPTAKPSAVRLDSCTVICIWNIWEPSRPRKVLVYESEVQCCCFSPGKAALVFAGTSVGSVVLWDLREHARNHHRLKIAEDEWTFRQPTFSTDAVMAGSGHFSSVTAVEVVPSSAAGGLGPEVPLMASEEESSGLSFQLASLDESGVLHFWVVVELPKANEAGSPTDLGLRPGGKIKLLHSSSLLAAERVSPRDAAKTGPLQTLQLKFLPTDSNHFFIGTNMGLVHHGTSHGLKAPPKFYRFQEPGVRPVDVSSIHFSPFLQHMFLVGCGDGSIRLHTVSREQPVAEWKNGTAGEPVVSLQWSQTRPAVFCVLDAASNVHMWDLLKNDAEPVVTEGIRSDRLKAMAVFGDPGQQNTYSGVALAHESGTIEMHFFERHFTASVPAEEEKLERMMTEAF